MTDVTRDTLQIRFLDSVRLHFISNVCVALTVQWLCSTWWCILRG